MTKLADVAERELRAYAVIDPDRCCGYFPALAGGAGIVSDLPACAAFAAGLPRISADGTTYRFNFLRLSLVRQSGDAAYHLDSDAETAITGELATLRQRRIGRLLLNLSAHSARALHYLNVDPWSLALKTEGSYIGAAQPVLLRDRARVIRIPPRHGATVHGAVFASNLVLHSGVDESQGHFVAAYGADTDGEASGRDGAVN